MRSTLRSLAMLGLLLILGAGLHAASNRGAAGRGLSGTIRVSGAWALYPMMLQWAEEFQKINPRVRIDVSAGGAGKGVADAVAGMVDIGMVSREIHPDEVRKGGYGVAVAKDAVVATANAANPAARQLRAQGVKRAAFVSLWIGGKPVSWGQVAGNPRISDAVRVYTRSDACGAADTWAKYLGKAQEDLGGVAVYGDPGVAEAIRKDKLGIGYNNLNYAYDSKTGRPLPGILVVPVDINGNGKLDKSESFYGTKAALLKAIATGVYPSPPARDLFLLTKGKPKGITRDFIIWILGDGQKYVDQAGYIQLPKQKLARSIALVK
jgi:phosphate transport system substrate-binding protein